MPTVNPPTLEERHAERDRRDTEQADCEEALSKLYRMEFYTSPCDSCGGHRQSRYVEIEEALMTWKEFIDSLNFDATRQSILNQWLAEDRAEEEKWLKDALGENSE